MLEKLEEIGGRRILIDSDVLIDYLRGLGRSQEFISH
ncbi:MAG: hypothetical protein KatS3mg096_083 [Candidatus Parcubacteria bacterium]|nr:MAG: hypothetical protein KatS3mg096_083 [Candidatus Parcubacteria bacterium]